jgi:hypothetical protein
VVEDPDGLSRFGKKQTAIQEFEIRILQRWTSIEIRNKTEIPIFKRPDFNFQYAIAPPLHLSTAFGTARNSLSG